MKRKIKVLIFAKPYNGGLFQYYFNAFKRISNVDPYIHFTYPNTFLDYVIYKTNKKKWFDNQIKKINAFKYDLGFIINTFPSINKLENKNNVLYLTDDALTHKSRLDLFKNIYISDKGYEKNFRNNKNFLGELAFAFDIGIHKSSGENKNRKLIQSIANVNNNRNKWFELMNEHNCFPDVYGNYFTKSKYFLIHPLKIKPSINFRSQNKVYSKYLISLNIHASIVKNGTNMKTFEASGFKVPQIISYTPGLENFFEPDKEIMIIRSIDEYKEKLKLLKNDKILRDTLTRNSYKRAIAMHKYEDRVKLILKNFKSS